MQATNSPGDTRLGGSHTWDMQLLGLADEQLKEMAQTVPLYGMNKLRQANLCMQMYHLFLSGRDKPSVQIMYQSPEIG